MNTEDQQALTVLEAEMQALRVRVATPKKAFGRGGQAREMAAKSEIALLRSIRRNHEKQLAHLSTAHNILKNAHEGMRCQLRNICREVESIITCGSGYTSGIRRNMVWEEYSVEFTSGERSIQCYHCGKILSFKEFTVDHLRPICMGGGDELENLRPSCGPCNWQRPVEDISRLSTTIKGGT